MSNVINFIDRVKSKNDEVKEEKPRDLLKEFGSFEALPEDEEFNINDVFNMFQDIEKCNQYLIIEHQGTDREVVSSADSEIRAFELYKNIRHNNKGIFKGDVVFKDMMGTKILQNYIIHERVK